MRIGGVDIPSRWRLDGHSDADVLAHAVTDAVLGAAAMGDIGQRFPDTDPQWAGADSMTLLATVVEEVGQKGLRVGNVDCTVILQSPKVGPHRDAIRVRLAHTLGCAVERVNVKATTGEGIGFVGRSEGAAALAVVTLAPVR